MVPGKLLLGFCMDFVILSAAPPGAVWSRRCSPRCRLVAPPPPNPPYQPLGWSYRYMGPPEPWGGWIGSGGVGWGKGWEPF